MFLTNNSSIRDLPVIRMFVFLSLYGSQPQLFWLPFTRVKSICTVRNAAIFSSSSGRSTATSSRSRWCPFHRPSFVLMFCIHAGHKSKVARHFSWSWKIFALSTPASFWEFDLSLENKFGIHLLGVISFLKIAGMFEEHFHIPYLFVLALWGAYQNLKF